MKRIMSIALALVMALALAACQGAASSSAPASSSAQPESASAPAESVSAPEEEPEEELVEEEPEVEAAPVTMAFLPVRSKRSRIMNQAPFYCLPPESSRFRRRICVPASCTCRKVNIFYHIFLTGGIETENVLCKTRGRRVLAERKWVKNLSAVL